MVDSVNRLVSLGDSLACNITKVSDLVDGVPTVHLLSSAIEVNYILSFSVSIDSSVNVNALANSTLNALISSVESGNFTANFMSQLSMLNVTNNALLTSSSSVISALSEVIIATYTPTTAPSMLPTATGTNPSSPPSVITNSSDGDNSITNYIIIGVVVGFVVFMGVVTFLYYYISLKSVPTDLKPPRDTPIPDMDKDRDFGLMTGDMSPSTRGLQSDEADTCVIVQEESTEASDFHAVKRFSYFVPQDVKEIVITDEPLEYNMAE